MIVRDAEILAHLVALQVACTYDYNDLYLVLHRLQHDNLVVRAADVVLKERRRLVLVVRETPLHKGHLELMSRVADLGGIILPPVPAFYHAPRSIEDLVDHTVGKILDLMDVVHNLFRRWEGNY